MELKSMPKFCLCFIVSLLIISLSFSYVARDEPKGDLVITVYGTDGMPKSDIAIVGGDAVDAHFPFIGGKTDENGIAIIKNLRARENYSYLLFTFVDGMHIIYFVEELKPQLNNTISIIPDPYPPNITNIEIIVRDNSALTVRSNVTIRANIKDNNPDNNSFATYYGLEKRDRFDPYYAFVAFKLLDENGSQIDYAASLTKNKTVQSLCTEFVINPPKNAVRYFHNITHSEKYFKMMGTLCGGYNESVCNKSFYKCLGDLEIINGTCRYSNNKIEKRISAKNPILDDDSFTIVMMTKMSDNQYKADIVLPDEATAMIYNVHAYDHDGNFYISPEQKVYLKGTKEKITDIGCLPSTLVFLLIFIGSLTYIFKRF